MHTILIVAAEKRELAGLLGHCRQVEKLPWPVRFARSAELNGTRLLLVANGPGRLAATAVEVAMQEARPEAVVSTGFCGALDPALRSGDIFVATRMLAAGAESPCHEGRQPLDVSPGTVALPATARPYRSGPLLSTHQVVGSVEEKERLFAAGAAAVEMEAGSLAARVRRSGLPFYCIRAVMDRADEGFSLDFNRLRDSNGRFSRVRVLRAALARPRRSLPELIRLERQGRRAARALGEFLVDCRF